MTREEAFTVVCAAIAESLDIPNKGICEDHRIQQDLGADSTELLEIAFILEKSHGVPRPPIGRKVTGQNFRTVGDICDYVERQTASTPREATPV